MLNRRFLLAIAFVFCVITLTAEYTFSFKPGWNLISPVSTMALELMPDGTVAVFEYTGPPYSWAEITTGDLNPGDAYFVLYNGDDIDVTFPGPGRSIVYESS